MLVVRKGIMYSTYYNYQYEIAEDLGIKNSSKASILSRCRVLGWTVDFDGN